MILERIKECLDNIGILSDDLNEDSSLLDILEESIMFITFIVELEEHFGIAISDEYLMPERLRKISDVIQMIQNQSDIISN